MHHRDKQPASARLARVIKELEDEADNWVPEFAPQPNQQGLNDGKVSSRNIRLEVEPSLPDKQAS